MSEPDRHLQSSNSDLPFIVGYVLLMAIQLPVWMFAGVLWGGFMFVAVHGDLINAIVGAFGWGLIMWLVAGNLLAVGLAWRRSTVLPVADRAAFRTALD